MSFILEALTTHDPHHIALKDGKQTLTYGGLQKAIGLYARKLKNISCAAIAMDNSVEWVIWDLAALENGTILIPLAPFFTAAQSDHAMRSAGCDALITPRGIERVENPPVTLPIGTAKITYTSGTTGTPKGVCLPASAMERVAQNIVQILGPGLTGHHLSVLPLAVLLENIAGVYAGLIAGCTITLPALNLYGKNYQGLHTQLKETKASSAILVPEILRALMAQVIAQGPLPDLTFLAVGGSKIDPVLITQARQLGLPVYEGYGLSECASVVALNSPSADRPGSVGKLLPHVRTSIVDDEIIIHDPGFLGYVGEDHTGAFSTGDIGHLDDKDFLLVTGRKKNILITSYGRNISPEWVEAALLAQPAIAQAVVFGDAQPHLSAFIVPAAATGDIQQAIDHANATLPDYAQVQSFYPISPLTPEDGTLTGTGRPRRSHIFELYGKDILHDIL